MKRKSINYLLAGFCCLMFCFSCGDDDENGTDPADDKPVIENAAVTPSSSVKYGDLLKLTGKLSDKTGLRSYTLKISNAQGDIWETTNMLTGTSQDLNYEFVLPLPKNAAAGNVNLSLTLKNSGAGSATQELTVSGVTVPTFDNLYFIAGNKTYTMAPDGEGLFVYTGLITANTVGKVYAKADKTGLYWGLSGGAATCMADGDFSIGNTEEKYMAVSFNPVTFAFAANETEEVWTETDAPIYIVGNISGHWADGNISDERAKMKMTAYASGDKRYWTWTPPSTGSGDPSDDMWGNINPGSFRFKLGGKEQYVLFQDGKITVGTSNDESASFLTSAGGPLTIKLFYDGTNYTSVSLENDVRSLEYLADGSMNINGAPAPTAIKFADADLAKKAGTFYVYEGTATLAVNQSITAQGTDLSAANADPDVFSGQGNSTWKVTGSAGQYTIRIDPFASTIYVCKQSGFPDVIYMDGWSWAKFEPDPTIVWNPEARLTLYRVGATGYVYEAVFYNNGWGGDVSFWSAYISDADFGKKIIASKYFDGVSVAGDGLLIPSAAGYYKVSVDLKDGFTYTEVMDGNYFTLQPTNNKKFTVTFTAR
jgi:hypothetical protein